MYMYTVYAGLECFFLFSQFPFCDPTSSTDLHQRHVGEAGKNQSNA